MAKQSLEKKYLIELTQHLVMAIYSLDAEMKKPSTWDRGESIAKIINFTDINNQMAMRYGLNYGWKKIENIRKRTLSNKITKFRDKIENIYTETPTGCGGSFGEIICWEIHTQGLTFKDLAEKWKIDTSFLGELIADHCYRL